MATHLSEATFAGGCFWCLEAIFKEMPGITQIMPGYMGGHTAYPTYQDVCLGTTGHAEVVQISFDINQLSYRQLLNIFFTYHDPTQLNRQGQDIGTQYRSAIFYHTDEQKCLAQAEISRLAFLQIYGRKPIVTTISAAETFYPAEDFHHHYFALHKEEPYCQLVIAPKVNMIRKMVQNKEAKKK